jgi:hypothetical protein
MKNSNTIKKICVASVALIFLFSAFLPTAGSLNINIFRSIESQINSGKQINSLDAPFADVWDITLVFNEPGGAYDNAFFGEKTDASDGQDGFDVPKSPAAFPPYIRGWFDTDFPDPYDELWEEYKYYPDDYKTWNLSVQWVPSDYSSPTTLTISWDNDSFSNSDYVTVDLYDVGSSVYVSDMIAEASYTFTCPALALQNFQIQCSTNLPPNAIDDSDTVIEDSTNNQIDVLANDNDPNGDTITIISITQPSNGLATYDTDYVYYTPNANYNGPDSFTYTISDGKGETDSATISITVTPANDPPNIPNTPSPADGAGDVDINVDLSWACSDPDGDILTYDVYFGTTSSPSLVSNNQTDTTYDPGTMSYSTQYYWQIVAWDPYGEFSIGSLWSFNTSAIPNNPPNIPYNPSPVDGGIDIDIIVNLSWACSDPDNDPLTYDIYFGDVNPPPLVFSGEANTTFNPGTINFDTTYYWKIVAWDNHSASNESPIWSFTTMLNYPPATPAQPSGPIQGYRGEHYIYNTVTTDPEGNQIYYWFEWGDGENTDWVGPFSSGEASYQVYAWSETGVFEIRVKARDEYHGESNWSEPLTVNIIDKDKPQLEIFSITGGIFSITAFIQNIGDFTARKINWNISVISGNLILGRLTSGTIDSLPPDGIMAIKSKFIFGFGFVDIMVGAEVDGQIVTAKSADAIVIGFLIWVFSSD